MELNIGAPYHESNFTLFWNVFSRFACSLRYKFLNDTKIFEIDWLITRRLLIPKINGASLLSEGNENIMEIQLEIRLPLRYHSQYVLSVVGGERTFH